MKFQTNSDNLFPEGSVVSAKAEPAVKLKIMRYLQRIYYCDVVDNPGQKQLAYFERELIAPVM